VLAVHGEQGEVSGMILVTGATGAIGSAVVSELQARGAAFRALVRDAQKLPAAIPYAVGDFNRLDTLRAALQGITRVFLLSPGIHPLQFERTLETIRNSGVQHVVKLSTLESGRQSDGIARWHRAEEERIETSGLEWTFVRPGNFASNALHWAGSIRSEGAVFAATGDGQSAPIDPRDIAAVCALALTEPGHQGKAHLLTGPALLSVADQVAILARLLETPLRFVDVEPAILGARMLEYQTPAELVEALVELWQSIRRGENAIVTDTVQALLGRPARTFEEWARAHLAAFAG
jgi:uncharacterized protein YbjT (DUF2867 family)